MSGFALSLVLKVRFFGTRKWPIQLQFAKKNENLLYSENVVIGQSSSRCLGLSIFTVASIPYF